MEYTEARMQDYYDGMEQSRKIELEKGCLNERLLKQVCDHEELRCTRADKSLGFQKMPEGYALMLNRDKSHYYWLKFDGSEGFEAWDKWYVYHSAKMNMESCELWAYIKRMTE